MDKNYKAAGVLIATILLICIATAAIFKEKPPKDSKPHINSVITTAVLTTEPETIKDFPCLMYAMCEREGSKMRVCVATSENAHKGDNMNVKILAIPAEDEYPQSKFSYELKIATKVTAEQGH